MKEIISFLAKVLIASLLGFFAASYADHVSRYHFADVALFFTGAFIAFYVIDGLIKKISRL